MVGGIITFKTENGDFTAYLAPVPILASRAQGRHTPHIDGGERFDAAAAKLANGRDRLQQHLA